MTFIQTSWTRKAKDGKPLCQAQSNKCRSKARYIVHTKLFGDTYVCAKHKKLIMSKKDLRGKVVREL